MPKYMAEILNCDNSLHEIIIGECESAEKAKEIAERSQSRRVGKITNLDKKRSAKWSTANLRPPKFYRG